jgi:hypothetical protein
LIPLDPSNGCPDRVWLGTQSGAAHLTSFPLCSYTPFMWGKADDLRLGVVMGLRKGLKLIRGMRRSLTEDEQL